MTFFRRDHQLRPGRSWHPGPRDITLLVTVLALLGLYTLGASIVDYTRTRQFDDWWSDRAHIDTFVRARFQAALDLPATMSLKQRLDPSRPDPGIIQLRLARAAWQTWQQDTAPISGQWQNATLARDGNLLRVKIRKRGDTSVHWMTDKKSFTLKTPKSSLFLGHRRLAFSVKEVLPLYLSNRLAEEFGLLAPSTTIAPVFVNDRYYGIFRVSEPINETFLRRHGRLPGNIFRGDTAERGEYYKGVPRPLFANPYIWDRVAFSGNTEQMSQATLKAFLHDVNGTTFEHHLKLMGRLDRQELSRFIAYLLVVGDFYHMSGVHNQFWYEDPSTGLMHPIPWDVLLLDLEAGWLRINRCLRAICQDPLVIDGAARELWNRLADDQFYKTAEQHITKMHARYKDHFLFDRYRRRVVSDVGTPSETLGLLRKNLDTLKRWLGDSTFACYWAWQSATQAVVDIESRGRVGGQLRAIELDGPLRRSESIRILADRNRNGVADTTDDELAGQWEATTTGVRFTLTEPLALLAGAEASAEGTFHAAPLHYRFFVVAPAHGDLGQPRIRPALDHRFSGEPAHLETLRDPMPASPTSSWHPWQFPRPTPKVHRLAGDVYIDKTMIIEPQDSVVIEPGTTLRLAHEVSIVCHGRLSAVGQPDHPITFRPAADGLHWGALVLQGGGADRSILRHSTFIGGGRCRTTPVQYKGMVSVHRAKDVTIEQCTFTDNVESDDALNAVHADVTIDRCEFARIHADAIDFDYSSGSIQHCQFTQCGNDAIDLMTSAPSIVSNRIIEAGDKGISIGESSHPFVFNNRMSHCRRGIEVKDGSEPYLINNTFTHNAVGIAQIAKNWRYGGGGWAKVVDCTLSENETDIQRDSRSRLTRAESQTDPELARLMTSDHTSVPANLMVPVESETFEDHFDQVPEHWIAAGTHARLSRRRGDLRMTIRRGDGCMSRNIAWDLTRPGTTAVVIFEIAGEHLESTEIRLRSSEGVIARQSFDPAPEFSLYRFVPIQLPPAHYSAIEIEATRADRTGRVALHGYRLYILEDGHGLTAAYRSAS